MSQHEREAFESSEHYFCGESPADRIVNWAVWKSAWQAALASQQQDHIGDSNKLVQAVNALAAQTGESPESIIEWLTDKGGLTQLMLSYFGGMQSQAQQTTELSDKCKVAASCLTYNDTEKEAVAKHLLLEASQQLRRVQAQQESQWLLIETAPKNKKIFVTYKNALGKKRTVFAKYLDKFTEEATAGTDCETDYCEADDTFYCKEGWVELIDNWDEFSSVYFDSRNVPTHWMPLPPAPEGDKP